MENEASAREETARKGRRAGATRRGKSQERIGGQPQGRTVASSASEKAKERRRAELKGTRRGTKALNEERARGAQGRGSERRQGRGNGSSGRAKRARASESQDGTGGNRERG